MKENSFKIAVIQMNSNEDIHRNVEYLFKIFEKIKTEHKGSMPRLICTPENSLYMRTVEGAPIEFLKIDNPEIQKLSRWCVENKTNLHLGSLPLEMALGKFNSSILLREDGKIEATYQKMHLFDIQLINQKPVRESDVFTHGAEPSVFEIDGWKFGQTVCYDVRFGELYRHYAHTFAVDALLIPAAFLVATGRAHWEILLRARAIENQAYVIAAAQAGLHASAGGPGRRTFGHSMVIDPWGYVLHENPSDLHYGIAELTAKRIEEVRAQIPMTSHRRQDFFGK